MPAANLLLSTQAGLRGVMYVRFKPEASRLAMPDVCCDLVWVREKLYVSGPATRGQPISWPGEEVILLNIDPLVARDWLGVPMKHLVDRRIELRDIDAARASPLEELFHAGMAGGLVDATLTHQSPSARVATAAHAIRRGISLESAASQVGLSGRQLERLFDDQLGISPRLYRRILRLRAALQDIAAGESLAGASAAAGYADQAHFTRDVRTFMGTNPGNVARRVGKVQDTLAYAREY